MDTKNLATRTAFGILYIGVLLFGILQGKYAFIAVFGTILGLALYEYFRLVERKTAHPISKIFNIISGIAIFFSAYLYLEGICTIVFATTSLLYILALIYSAVLLKREDIYHSIIYSVFGQIYITLPLCLLLLISYQYEIEADKYKYIFVLAIFVFIWLNDTAAYLIGSMFGKHKLIERISPRKSMEGFIGGVVFTVLAGMGFAYIYTEYPILFWIGFALIVSLFGTLGDLFESLIKRTYQVKDAGNLIPGHGGILDRIDSLLIVVPAIFLYLMLSLAYLKSTIIITN